MNAKRQKQYNDILVSLVAIAQSDQYKTSLCFTKFLRGYISALRHLKYFDNKDITFLASHALYIFDNK